MLASPASLTIKPSKILTHFRITGEYPHKGLIGFMGSNSVGASVKALADVKAPGSYPGPSAPVK